MTQRAELEEMRVVLLELQKLLQAEGFYSDYAFLFRRCFELLSWTDTEPEAIEALKEYLLSIPDAPGSFRDFGFWRDSFEERKRINERLDSLRDRLFALARSL